MKAVTPIKALPKEPFEIARDAANAWRGRCLDLFTRCEAAVTETLLVLAANCTGPGSVKRPHLLGQRYDALADAIGSGGPFQSSAGSAAGSLDQLKQLDSLRTHLAHGVFTVTLDHTGTWHLISTVLSLRASKESRDTYVVDQEGAAAALARLERIASRLRSDLGQVRERCRDGSAVGAAQGK